MSAEPLRRRRILVVGAYGLIGAHVLARLHARRAEITGLGRNIASAARRFPYAEWIEADVAAMTKPEDWASIVDGFDAVVNCAGALQNGPADDLQGVHVEGTLALYRACIEAGVRRVVHLSAAGVEAGRRTAFYRTKLAAEEGLKELDLDWIILRPGLVLGPYAHGGSALLRGLAALPGILPVIYRNSPIQLVSVDDVAEAAVRATEPWRHTRLSLDLVSDETLTLGDILKGLRAWLGLAPARILRLPALLAWPIALGADALSLLGWRSPMRSTTLRQLKGGIRGDGAAAQRALGLKPKDFATMLAGWPSGVEERWFARLYFLKPLAIATLALFWIASGIIGLVRLDLATAILRDIGWPPLAATGAVALAAVIDILLGLAVLIRRRSRLALGGMVLISLAYLAIASVLQPELWLDPLGPLVKTIPAAVLALLTLALMDER